MLWKIWHWNRRKRINKLITIERSIYLSVVVLAGRQLSIRWHGLSDFVFSMPCLFDAPTHECLLTNRQYCESSPELHSSAVIPCSWTFRVSKHIFDLVCFNNPPSRNSHRWFSLSPHKRIITMDPLAYETNVKQRSWCLIWPFFVIVHSWLPPVSWHW